MPYFIKAAEAWLPDLSGQHLVLASATYSELQGEALSAFQSESEESRFRINEGLPGKTWAARRPLIWTDLNTNHFKRREVANIAGLVCGASIPVFAGEFMLGIIVLFFADSDASNGAVEVWQNRDYYDRELRLVDGYYGELSNFEFISRHLTIMKGRGLPGLAWESSAPVIMTQLGEANGFLRARNAAESGITSGLAIPFFYTDRDVQALVLLSTQQTPIAKRFEIWAPDQSELYLLFQDGVCAEGSDLQATYRGAAFDRGDSALGHTWLTGRPMVESSSVSTEAVVYIPLLMSGALQSIVKLVF